MGLKSKTPGLLGLGRLGVTTANVGIKAAAWSQTLTQKQADEQAKAFRLPSNTIEAVGSEEELLQHADILSIHYVLSDRSRSIIGADELKISKPNAIIVNTSRGPLVNDDAGFERNYVPTSIMLQAKLSKAHFVPRDGAKLGGLTKESFEDMAYLY